MLWGLQTVELKSDPWLKPPDPPPWARLKGPIWARLKGPQIRHFYLGDFPCPQAFLTLAVFGLRNGPDRSGQAVGFMKLLFWVKP